MNINIWYTDVELQTKTKKQVQIWPKKITSPEPSYSFTNCVRNVQNIFDEIHILKDISTRHGSAKVMQAAIYIKEIDMYGRFDLRAESLVELLHTKNISVSEGVIKGKFSFDFSSSSYRIIPADNVISASAKKTAKELIPFRAYKDKVGNSVIYLGKASTECGKQLFLTINLPNHQEEKGLAKMAVDLVGGRYAWYINSDHNVYKNEFEKLKSYDEDMYNVILKLKQLDVGDLSSIYEKYFLKAFYYCTKEGHRVFDRRFDMATGRTLGTGSYLYGLQYTVGVPSLYQEIDDISEMFVSNGIPGTYVAIPKKWLSYKYISASNALPLYVDFKNKIVRKTTVTDEINPYEYDDSFINEVLNHI